ncbi:hypothetical protein SAMN05216266_101756 [Amycolatopsis marina]|uniref:Uncharacterized protein n=1 Tax=Amycolatopsis marina TaxID=490629 RepID=A0A1I0W6F8_9PSEU|nr:hypothetical protein [Amycolatopsis marina]SFA83898.1 hypothetical protein SAMN05216266_101756 [Amycolatopsis marina]
MSTLRRFLGSIAIGLILFITNLLMQALFVATDWWEAYGFAASGPVEDFLPTLVAATVIYPATFSGLLLITLALLPATTRFARAAFTDPVSLATFAVFAAGLIAYAMGSLVAGQVLAWVAVIVASITQFRVEDRGKQPLLGLTFLIFGYLVGLCVPVTAIAANEPFALTLPASMPGWTAAAANLGLVLFTGYRLWLRSRTTQSPAPAATPPPET